jgi:hypothetical protein
LRSSLRKRWNRHWIGDRVRLRIFKRWLIGSSRRAQSTGSNFLPPSPEALRFVMRGREEFGQALLRLMRRQTYHGFLGKPRAFGQSCRYRTHNPLSFLKEHVLFRPRVPTVAFLATRETT